MSKGIEGKRIMAIGGGERGGMSSLVNAQGEELGAKDKRRIILANYYMFCPLCDEDEALKEKRIRFIAKGLSPGRVYVMMCKHLRVYHKQIEPSWFFSRKRKKIREEQKPVEELEPSPIQWYGT